MVLGDVVGVEPRLLVGGDDFEPLGVIPIERPVVPVEVVEDAEVQTYSSFWSTSLTVEKMRSICAFSTISGGEKASVSAV